MMSIKERYKELTQKKLSLENFQEIVELKNQCKMEMNQEYLYLCDILIIDIYINENLFDDALNIALKSLNNIDNIVFQKIYVSFLERVIYIFIQKKNFKSAYRYAFMKRNSIDVENIDEVNRWYLEMAYIYAELNQKEKALSNLKAILSNYPNESLKALTLSNMTKLYIDQEQIEEAKDSLSDCITLVYQLDDEEGILYCEYLNAKLYILERNYKFAKQSFQDIFKNIHNISNDYLSIANEYIALLIEMELYDEAYRISIKYLKDIEKTDDLYIKKDFYKNYLKIHVFKNKSVRDDLKPLLNTIEILESEINKNDQNIINESNEDDKNLEVASRIRDVITKVEKTINVVNIALKNENERDCFMEFSKQLEEVVRFDEALYVLFSKADFEVLPYFFDNFNRVSTFDYKKQRLYEREYPFNNLNGTIVEMLISSNHEVMIDFYDSPIPVKNLITEKTYSEEFTKSLIAIPLNYDNEMFGCAIFTSDDNSLVDMDAMVNLKLAVKQLEFKLISLFYQENKRSQKNILQVALKDLHEGLFYMDPLKRKIFLTDNLANFLAVENRSLTKDEYLNKINEDDVNIYLNVDRFVETGEPYKIEYRLNANEKEYLVCEKANPYISKDGIIKYYVGTIVKLDNAILVNDNDGTEVLDDFSFQKKFEELTQKAKELEYKCSFAKFTVEDINHFNLKNKDKILDYIYSVVKENFSHDAYLLSDNSVISIIEVNDQRIIDKKVKTIFNVFDQGILFDNLILNFDVNASVVRFPRDTYNLQEVLAFCNIALEEPNRYQVFNEDLRKKYLKKKAVTTCVSEHLKKDSLELLYLPLETKDNSLAYEVKYNINGLLPKESIFEYLDKNVVLPFEKLVLKGLLKDIKESTKARYYLHISCLTLDLLMKDDFFKLENLEQYHKIIFCIDDISDNLDKILNYLYNFGFKVNINYRVVKKLSLELLLFKNINGLSVEDAIDDRNRLLSICECLNFELLTNYVFPDYKKITLRTEELLKFSDIKDKVK